MALEDRDEGRVGLLLDPACSILGRMADPYIDQYETIAYGRFAVDQISALVIGLDPQLDGFVQVVSARLATDTDAMESVLTRVGELSAITYKAAPGAVDVPTQARDVFRRFLRYVDSRANGDALMLKLIGSEKPGTVLRRRPVKLAAAIQRALSALPSIESELQEYATWVKELSSIHGALADLNEGVRKARADRRQMTPEVAAARTTWLARYAATKSLIEGILRPLDKLALMPEIFDDLAETHRAPGVSDENVANPSDPSDPVQAES